MVWSWSRKKQVVNVHSQHQLCFGKPEWRWVVVRRGTTAALSSLGTVFLLMRAGLWVSVKRLDESADGRRT
eukprot:3193542-Karenia_brevis.AAC.1